MFATHVGGCTLRLNNPISRAARTSGNLGLTTTSTTVQSGSVTAVYPTQGANWMDYVRNNNGGTDPFDQPDQACTNPSLPSAGFMTQGCIHGGELRQVIVTGVSSCSGITASDALGVFEWHCRVKSGTARVFSYGFRRGRGLRDLIDSGGASFVPNSVTVLRDGSPVLQTSSAVWWTNSFGTPPSSAAAPQNLTGAGTIYTVTSDLTGRGYNLNANRVAFVTVGSARLIYDGSGGRTCNYSGDLNTGGGSYRVPLCVGNNQFTWIEAKIVGYPGAGTIADSGIYFGDGGANGTVFNRIHNTDIELTGSAAPHAGIFIEGQASRNWVSDVRISRISENVVTERGGFNLLTDIYASNNAWELGADNDSVLQRVFAYGSGGNGMIVGNSPLSLAVGANVASANFYTGASSARLVALTAANNGSHGLFLDVSTGSLINNILVTNTSSSAQGLVLASSADSHRFRHLALTDLGDTAIVIPGANNNLFDGPIFLGPYGFGPCSVTGTGNTLDNSCNYGGGSTAPTSVGSASASVIGPITTNDALNSSDSNGTAAYAAALDWTNLESPYRGWGAYSASAWPAATHQGPCTSGTCQIYDWRLRSTDTAYLNRNGVFTPGAACPASVDASNANNVLSSSLVGAVEIVGDYVGDEDSRCESNETCLYLPNIGGYQGEGYPHNVTPCTFTGGNGVTGVRMLAYPTNGV